MRLFDQSRVGPVFKQETGSGSGSAGDKEPAKQPAAPQQQQQQGRRSQKELDIIQWQQTYGQQRQM